MPKLMYPMVGTNQEMQDKADSVFARQIWFKMITTTEPNRLDIADKAVKEFQARVKAGFFEIGRKAT